MENTNLPDSVNPAGLATQLMDGTPVPAIIHTAGEASPQQTQYDNPGLPPLDPNDPNAHITCPKNDANAAQQDQQPPPPPVSVPVAMPANPKPLNQATFQEIVQEFPAIAEYNISDASGQNYKTFRQTAGYNLPFNFGFNNLDAIQPVVPGLYVLGAASSMGKTTFALQLADQIGFQGQPVLYFSREMSAIDLMSKSVSRLINQEAEHDSTYCRYTALEIKKGIAENSREFQEQLKAYETRGGSNICIIKLSSEMDIYFIISFIRKFIETTGKRPVVIIDYLQILGATKLTLPDGRIRVVSDTRENIQRILEVTKDFQLANNLMVLMVCSLNRSSYTDNLKFEAFKETGSIEYTADVVWGLQLSVMSQKEYADTLSVAKVSTSLSDLAKRKLLATEKTKFERQMTLKCLKNRVGIPEYDIEFVYQTRYDTYVPKGMPINIEIGDDDDDDKHPSITILDTSDSEETTSATTA